MVDAGGIANNQHAPSAPLTPVDTGLGCAKLTLPLLQEKNETAKGLYDKQYGTRPPVLDSE
jgi:membrane fusion protein, hemolysin D